jgi:hypothetical protein
LFKTINIATEFIEDLTKTRKSSLSITDDNQPQTDFKKSIDELRKKLIRILNSANFPNHLKHHYDYILDATKSSDMGYINPRDGATFVEALELAKACATFELKKHELCVLTKSEVLGLYAPFHKAERLLEDLHAAEQLNYNIVILPPIEIQTQPERIEENTVYLYYKSGLDDIGYTVKQGKGSLQKSVSGLLEVKTLELFEVIQLNKNPGLTYFERSKGINVAYILAPNNPPTLFYLNKITGENISLNIKKNHGINLDKITTLSNEKRFEIIEKIVDERDHDKLHPFSTIMNALKENQALSSDQINTLFCAIKRQENQITLRPANFYTEWTLDLIEGQHDLKLAIQNHKVEYLEQNTNAKLKLLSAFIDIPYDGDMAKQTELINKTYAALCKTTPDKKAQVLGEQMSGTNRLSLDHLHAQLSQVDPEDSPAGMKLTLVSIGIGLIIVSVALAVLTHGMTTPLCVLGITLGLQLISSVVFGLAMVGTVTLAGGVFFNSCKESLNTQTDCGSCFYGL